MKVMVVDDDPATRLVTAIVLEETAGFEVVQVESGLKAVEEARRELPDVILLDLVLPELDGPEVLQQIRSDEQTRSIPVILHTADDESGGLRQLMDLGAAGFILKPFDPLRLAQEIVRILDRGHS
ncbi:MAG: response regulator [Acidobacteria bacterium]|nr:response regulator [Acidobacteriota bacterium]